jgi:hypothetical protein
MNKGNTDNFTRRMPLVDRIKTNSYKEYAKRNSNFGGSMPENDSTNYQ